jgi:hypothetical protein
MNVLVPPPVRWPLRSLGFDRGRALMNANPTPLQIEQQRCEQRAAILEGLAHDGTRRSVARRAG